MRLSQVNIRRVLGLIFVNDGVAFVVVARADEPTVDTPGVARVGDAATGRFAVQGGDVVARNGAPMDYARLFVGPALDTGKASLSPLPHATYVISPTRLSRTGPCETGFCPLATCHDGTRCHSQPHRPFRRVNDSLLALTSGGHFRGSSAAILLGVLVVYFRGSFRGFFRGRVAFVRTK